MVHRLAIFLGGVGAAAVLALSMNMGGLFTAAPTAADPSAATTGADQAVAAAPDTTKTVIDKVYVEPTPQPAVVHVNKPRRNPAPAPTVSQPRGEREPGDGGERGGD
ncbi:MAG: hypothetical protein QFC55_05190 [Chloroflexota bacterium]|nr:hypothetical protein [Chloroflexota bacterium]